MKAIWIPALRIPSFWTMAGQRSMRRKRSRSTAMEPCLAVTKLVATAGATAIAFSKMWSNDQVIASIASLGTDFVHHGLDESFADKQRFRREEDSING